MYQFVFNEANRHRIQTVVMIVRTDILNGLPCKLTRPGREDSFRSCRDPGEGSQVVTGTTAQSLALITEDLNNYYNQLEGLELVWSAELVVILGHERAAMYQPSRPHLTSSWL